MGFAASTIIHLVPDDHTKDDQVVFAIFLCVAGVGTITGGFLGGKVCDVYSMRKGGVMLIIWYVAACLVCYLTYFIENMPLVYISRLCWGFQIAFQQSYVMVSCSKMYEGSKQSFAIVRQVHSLTFIIYEVISMTTHNSISIAYIVPAMISLIIPCLIGLKVYPK